MSDYKVTGTVIHVGEVQTFDGGFQKREFVIKTVGEYPQQIKLELLKDKVGLIKEGHKDHAFDVHFNLNGRAWEGKWFINLVAWKVTDLTQEATTPTKDASAFGQDIPNDNDDELPF